MKQLPCQQTKIVLQGLRGVAEQDLPSIHEALGSVPNTEKQKQTTKSNSFPGVPLNPPPMPNTRGESKKQFSSQRALDHNTQWLLASTATENLGVPGEVRAGPLDPQQQASCSFLLCLQKDYPHLIPHSSVPLSWRVKGRACSTLTLTACLPETWPDSKKCRDQTRNQRSPLSCST